MHSLIELRLNNKKFNSGNNDEKFFQPSIRRHTLMKTKEKYRISKSSNLQLFYALPLTKYVPSIIVRTAIYMFLFDVLIQPCSSQLDIGIYETHIC